MSVSSLSAALLLAATAEPVETVTPPLEPVSPPAVIAAPTPPASAEPDGITVSGRLPAPPEDPMQGVNAVSYAAIQAVDDAVVAPVAFAYRDTVARPVRTGIRNVINNLDEPIVFVSFLLQLKPGKAMETLGRFAINSTIGVAGLMDVAKSRPFHLPHRYNGLAQTLGYYGIGPGPYLYLPAIGPTTVRDMLGRMIDLSLVPSAVGKPLADPLVSLGKGTITALDDRVRDDPRIRETRLKSGDGYTATREWYLHKRQTEIEILQGKRPDPHKRKRLGEN